MHDSRPLMLLIEHPLWSEVASGVRGDGTSACCGWDLAPGRTSAENGVRDRMIPRSRLNGIKTVGIATGLFDAMHRRAAQRDDLGPGKKSTFRQRTGPQSQYRQYVSYRQYRQYRQYHQHGQDRNVQVPLIRVRVYSTRFTRKTRLTCGACRVSVLATSDVSCRCACSLSTSTSGRTPSINSSSVRCCSVDDFPSPVEVPASGPTQEPA